MYRVKAVQRVGAIGLLALVACSGAKTSNARSGAPPARPAGAVPSGGPATVDLQEYGRKYLGITTSVLAAATSMSAQLSKLGLGVSPKATTSLTAPLADDYAAADTALLQYVWPPTVRAEITRLVTANEAIVSDLRRMPADIPGGVAAWRNEIVIDTGKAKAEDSAVRAALGLPAPS